MTLIKGNNTESINCYASNLQQTKLLFSCSLVLSLLCFLFIEQVEEASFSLNHPNQYFIESQKVLAGGRDIKRETDAPQKPQENSTKAPSAAPEAAANTQDVAEMTEELDSFFQDA